MSVRHLLVGNPTAQSGKNAARIAEAMRLLDGAGVAHRFVATAPAGGTVRLVADALAADRALDTAIYMGGDGTFAEVAKGILASGRAAEVRLAMLPTGTANDQGKSFGLGAGEPDLPRNVRVIADGNEARLDAGRLIARDAAGTVVRDDWFFDSAGWGISPRVLSLRNEDRKLIGAIPVVRDVWRDQLVYAGALLRTFLGSYVDDGKFDVRVTADGAEHTWRGLTDLIVKGTRIYGGLWVFDPDARHDDGRFEVVPFVGKRDWISKAIVHLDGSGAAADALAAVGVRHSDNLSAATIELAFDEQPGQPLAAQIDGEEFPATPQVRIEVAARALRVVVLAEHATERP
ncbi:MAG TPA: diacylglycerol kinase family protein [Polyangia bacterium]